MKIEKHELSKVVPLLVAALVCDVAVADPSTGKKNLIGIFDRILVAQVPTKRPMSVYFKVTDTEGYYDFDVKYIQVGTGKVLAGAQTSLHTEDRLVSRDLHIPFPPLPIPSHGRYEFQVWANSMYLGSAVLDVLPRNIGG